MTCQLAAKKNWDLFHIDLKTAFLQGESYDVSRNVICQLPPQAGYLAHIGARLKIPAYGLNDAPRRWWNILDTSLRSYGMIPTRDDRCCYVFHSIMSTKKWKTQFESRACRYPCANRKGHRITDRSYYRKSVSRKEC